MKTIKILARAIRYIFRGVPVVQTFANVKYLSPSNKLQGKKVLITGGGRGLGFAMAKRFVEEGATVVISGRNEDVLKVNSEKIGCKYLVYNVCNVSESESFIAQADKLIGGINCLVNNAGVSMHENSFLEVSEEQYDKQFDVNLKGPFFLTQAFIKNKMKRDNDELCKILFISSETSMTVDERPYGLTKASLNSLIQGLACKYIKDGFIINGLAPGITASEMTGYKEDGDLYLSINPSKRVYLPGEVAEIASFLLCDSSNTLNGQIIYTNEGRTINTRW